MAKGWLIALITLAVIGVALICLAGGLFPYFEGRLKPEVDKNVILKNNTEAYKAWLSPPAPIFIDFYFFHVVNPREIVNGSKPKVVQRGPYVYREIREKLDVQFKDNDTELYYKEGKWYVFDADLSNGTEDDNITNLDVALMTVADRLRYKSNWIQFGVKVAISVLGGTLFTEKTVKQLLWGYTPDVLVKLKQWFPQFPFPNITAGFYVGPTANGTDSGALDISTGVSNVSDLGLIRSWNGSSTLSFWSTPICNMINGTDGTLFHPFVQKTEKLYIFSTDMCRSVYVVYDKDSTVSASHIPVYQFKIPAVLLANTSVNPDNEGFCTPLGNCLRAGVLNVSNCRDKVPIVLSMPHFLDADKFYQDSIEGLHPDHQTHTTVIDAEPTTGIVLNAAKKIQINFYVRAKLKSFEQTQKLSGDLVFPLFWVDEHAQITDADAAKFKEKVLEPMYLAKILLFVLIGCGILFILIVIVLGVIMAVRHKRSGESSAAADDDDPLITDAGTE